MSCKQQAKISAYFFNTMYMLIKTKIYNFPMNFDYQNGYCKWFQTFENLVRIDYFSLSLEKSKQILNGFFLLL